MTSWWLAIFMVVGAAGCGLLVIFIAMQLGLGLSLPSGMFAVPWR